MNDKPDPKFRYVISQGEQPEQQSDGLTNALDVNALSAASGIPEEKPHRKSLRERNIIRLLELGDEAVSQRDYRAARRYYNEARNVFNSREAIERIRDLDRSRREAIKNLIFDPQKRKKNIESRGKPFRAGFERKKSKFGFSGAEDGKFLASSGCRHGKKTFGSKENRSFGGHAFDRKKRDKGFAFEHGGRFNAFGKTKSKFGGKPFNRKFTRGSAHRNFARKKG